MGSTLRWLSLAVLASQIAVLADAQNPSTSTPAPTADRNVEHAQSLIGRALILRGFYAGNELTYDASGQIAGTPKITDWTLAAVDIQKAERKAPGRVELDGFRVAIRYNPDQHLFERHQQKDEKVQIEVADTGDPKAFDAALKKVFSTGIDPALQASMPDFWQHYFKPAMPWPQDALAGKNVLVTSAAPAAGTVEAAPEKKVEPKLTPPAEHDHVKGNVQVRLIVDEQGQPKRVSVLMPLGYGLDERTVEAIKQWRFHPATRDQKPLPAAVVISQGFEYRAP